MRKDNRIVINLNSVQWAKFYYQNQYGDRRDLKPVAPTNNGFAFDSNAIVHASDPKEMLTMYRYAKEHNLLDVWQPHVVFKLSASETLIYTGDKAIALYKEWCVRIFNKRNKQKKG